MSGSSTLDRLAIGSVLVLPLALLTTRGGAEILIGAVDAMFLLQLARHPTSWPPRQVVLATAAWWGWTIFASLRQVALGAHGLIEALLMGRFFLFAAALSGWLLRTAAARRAIALSVAAAAVWIALECWQQYLTGADMFGWPRYGDGALTGPFEGPRAGPVLVLILFPALLPPVMTLLGRPDATSKAAAGLLATWAAATMILIGQRMPAVLTLLGLLTCAILLRPVRPIVGVTAVLCAILLALTPVISPPTFAKLVVHFSDQMSHFDQSAYGQIYARATVMTLAHPWAGLGFDGFRVNCDAAQYRHGLVWLGLSDRAAAGPEGCNIHPHNHYLEAATAGGVTGLLLFSAAVLTWLAALGRGLLSHPSARRAGLFIAILLAVWPFASTSAFFTLPNAGWTFLLLGWGFAEVESKA